MIIKKNTFTNTRKKESNRRHDIDWLRVIAIFLLVPFHTGRIFDIGWFYIKNPDTSIWIENGVHFFLGQWRMALLFFVSGVGTRYALGFRSSRKYIKERFFRLIIPLLAGILIIVPPQVYYMLRFKGSFTGTYIHFYPEFYNGIRPNGNFEWAHLWFLAYLFVFSILLLPIFEKLRSQAFHNFIPRYIEKVKGIRHILIMAIPLMITEILFRPHWPGFQNLYNDWANFFFYLILFFYGYAVFINDHISDLAKKNLGKLFLIAFCMISILYTARLMHVKAEMYQYSIKGTILNALTALNTWLWVITMIGAARKYLSFNHSFLRYSQGMIYPLYILHQTIIVAIGYYVIQLDIAVSAKFSFICFITFGLSYVIYEYILKPFPFMHILFGIKSREKAISKEESKYKKIMKTTLLIILFFFLGINKKSLLLAQTNSPEFLKEKEKIPQQLLEEKKEGWYVTGLPNINFNSDAGFGYGASLFLFNNGPKDHTFFAYTPYLQKMKINILRTTDEIEKYEIFFDSPYVFNSPIQLEMGIGYNHSPTENFFGSDLNTQNALQYKGKEYTSIKDYNKELQKVLSGKFTNLKYHQYDIVRYFGYLNANYFLLGELLHPGLGYALNFSNITDYTGKIVKASENQEVIQNETLLYQYHNEGRIAGFYGGFSSVVNMNIKLNTTDYKPDPRNGMHHELIFLTR
ncbi:MAG: acyltransferase [Spirochaetia bacterium]|nr:acyltransferase [Spirochaetia bacterium]